MRGQSNAVGSASTGTREGVAVDGNCAAMSALHDVEQTVATAEWLEEDFGLQDLAFVLDDDE
jgi:hypothetical protein